MGRAILLYALFAIVLAVVIAGLAEFLMGGDVNGPVARGDYQGQEV
jgi:hypothetical protein